MANHSIRTLLLGQSLHAESEKPKVVQMHRLYSNGLYVKVGDSNRRTFDSQRVGQVRVKRWQLRISETGSIRRGRERESDRVSRSLSDRSRK